MTRQQIGTASVANGIAETTYVIPGDATTGNRTLYATYEQNDDYMLAEGYNTIEIRVPTETTVDNVLASIGETATFSATVKHHTSQNVNEGTVQFQLGGVNIGSPVNVSNGIATLQYEIPSNTEDGTEITAIFIETLTYGASTSTAGILSIREGTNVVVGNLSANRGTTATITATVTDADGDNVSTGQAQLYIDNTLSGEPVNVVGGSVSFSYEVANNAVVGGHAIKVAYLQNDTYDPAEGTATLTVRTPTTLTAVNVSGNKGATVPVTIRVTDPNSSAIIDGTVNITVGEGTPQSATVGTSGEATIQYEIPSNASGTISFTATYVENVNYQGSVMATNGVITVRKGVTIVVDSVKAELGDEITLGATVTDENSALVDEGTVNYEIE